ncbi:MAG: hypothetical protein ABIO44_13420, partial [Saprospiraceae bacterium]
MDLRVKSLRKYGEGEEENKFKKKSRPRLNPLLCKEGRYLLIFPNRSLGTRAPPLLCPAPFSIERETTSHNIYCHL